MPGFFELISFEETKGPQPQKSHGPSSVCFFQEINKQELEVAHAGDLYDKAHGDSMRAEKALKATFQGVGLPGPRKIGAVGFFWKGHFEGEVIFLMEKPF